MGIGVLDDPSAPSYSRAQNGFNVMGKCCNCGANVCYNVPVASCKDFDVLQEMCYCPRVIDGKPCEGEIMEIEKVMLMGCSYHLTGWFMDFEEDGIRVNGIREIGKARILDNHGTHKGYGWHEWEGNTKLYKK